MITGCRKDDGSMKLITETLVRQMMKVEDFGRLFEVPCGSLLTPAARDYLTSNKITVSVVGKRAKSEKKVLLRRYLRNLNLIRTCLGKT